MSKQNEHPPAAQEPPYLQPLVNERLIFSEEAVSDTKLAYCEQINHRDAYLDKRDTS